jgi:hypothetical protein
MDDPKFTKKERELVKQIAKLVVENHWEVRIITGLNFKPVCTATEKSGSDWLSAEDIKIPHRLYEKLAYESAWLRANGEKNDTAFTSYLVFTPEAICKVLFDYSPSVRPTHGKGA